MLSLANVAFMAKLNAALKQFQHKGVSLLRMGKKWHPELEDATITVAHFAKEFAKAYVHG
jgi:hypothetical protein